MDAFSHARGRPGDGGLARLHTATCLLLLLVLAGLPTVARSEDLSDARARAVKLTSEGAAAYKAEDYAKAFDKFGAAYRTYPAAPLLLNMSRAALKLNRCADAIHYAELFKASNTRTRAGSPDSPYAWNETVQRSCIDAEVDSVPPGAAIWIDGDRQPDKTPWTGRLPVGKHKILLWRPGYQKQGAFLLVSADAPAHLELHLYPWANSESPPTEATIAPAEAKPAAPAELALPDLPAPRLPGTSPAPVAPAPVAPAPVAAPVAPAPVAVTPTPAPAPAPAPVVLLPPPAPPPRETSPTKTLTNPVLRNVGYAGIAVGGAALVAALVLGVTEHNDSVAAGKTTSTRTVSQAAADLSSINERIAGADALYGIGGVLAAGGVALAVVF